MKQFIIGKKGIICFAVAMLFMGSILIYRAFYGMDITDETFYLATAKRFHDGDLLFKNDWNTAQLFGLLMVPFYRIYLLLHGNSEGIILCARILFVALEVFTSCFLFRVLLNFEQSFGAAFMSSLCILVYARGNIPTISYYNLGFLTFLLSILWWMEAGSAEKKWCFILSGACFAVSVICMPYLVILFIIFTGMAFFKRIKRKGEKEQCIYWWIVGVLCSAVAFLLYFWRWIPWNHIFEYIPLVFLDPGLENVGLLGQLWDLLSYLLFVFLKYTWFLYIVTFIIAFLAGKGFIKKKSILQKIPGLLLVEFLIQSVYVRSYFEGGIIVTFLLFVLQLQFFSPQCRIKKLEVCFVMPGLLFGIAWVLGSNVGERVINMSVLLIDLWAVCFLWAFCKHYNNPKRIVWMRMPIYMLFIVLFIIRIFDIYRDGSIWKLSDQISQGCMKGIYTEDYRREAYENTLRMLRLEMTQNDTIVVLGRNPWVYLDVESRCGSYSTWSLENGEELLKYYFEINPEKIPNAILIVPKELNIYESWKYSSHGAGVHEEPQPVLGGALKELTEREGYIYKEDKGVILYKKW